MFARAIASRLPARFGQPVVVENRTGAGGTIGSHFVAKSPADGYTLLMVTTAMLTNAATGRKLPFDLMVDLAPIGMVGSSPLLVVVPAQSKARTLRELIDMARDNPNGVRYGSSGVGTMSHIGMELLASQAGVRLMHVPYKGTTLAMTDLLSGRLQVMLGSFPTLLPLLRTGKLRCLALASNSPSTFAPMLPTASAAGFPDFLIEFWWGIMAPARIPTALQARLNGGLQAALADRAVLDIMQQMAAVPRPGPADDFGRLVGRELRRWATLITDARIQVES